LYRIVVMNVPVGPDKDDTATFPRSAGVARMPSASYHNSPLLWSSNVTEGGCKFAEASALSPTTFPNLSFIGPFWNAKE
jgi:hypothetical protein